MRILALRGLLAAALCTGLAMAVRAADDRDAPAAPSGISGWWNGLFGGKEKPVEKAVEKKVETVEKPAVPTAADRAALLRREQDAYFRRMEVCRRLQAVADEKNDHELMRHVDKMMDEIGDVYTKRTASLAASGVDDETPPPLSNPKAEASPENKKFRTVEGER